MTPEEFASCVRESIVNENSTTYRTLLETTSVEAASDPYWRDLLDFHQRLSIRDRRILHAVMRQVAVDTVSNLFAVIDGVTRLERQSERVELVGTDTKVRLQGSLQDIFLQSEEMDRGT